MRLPRICFLAAALAGCTANPSLQDLTPEQRARSATIKLYELPLEPGSYRSVGPVEGVSCKSDLYGTATPSRAEAVQGMILRAAVLGAEGVGNIVCQAKSDYDITTGCWASVLCKGDAVTVTGPSGDGGRQEAAAPAPAPATAAADDEIARLTYPLTATQPDDIAVIIGNSDYDRFGHDIPRVLPAGADAEAIRRFAVEGLGVPESNIIDLRNATVAQLVEVFGNERDHRGKLFDWVKPGRSRVLVYYAGHGAPSGQGGHAMLVPVDASLSQLALSGYPLDLLYANLGKLPARRVTVMLEACFSGASPAGTLIVNASPITVVPKAPALPARLTVIAAGASDQIASWDPEKRHGLFTHFFLLGMAGAADRPPYGNGDGTVSAAELERYVKEQVSYAARRIYGRDQNVQFLKGGE